MPGFVPGVQNVFAPVKVAIAPPGGRALQSQLEVGAVFESDGEIRLRLYTRDFGNLLARSLARGLEDAGLRPVALGAVPPGRTPPEGAQLLLVAQLEDLRVNQRFGAETTVHGRYFTMHSRIALRIEMFDRAGRMLFSGEVSGAEDEPPAPVGGEVFLPLETDPAESLSVALSRAIGAIILEPGIRRALPAR